jgi:predicted O-methyltransferase YrrM
MDQDTLARVKAISMLSEPVLERLAECASRARAGILEIGPYIGGSTVALAIGNQGRVPHVAIEMGGAYPDQPFLPSKDIVSDLRANLSRFGVADRVEIVVGSCYDAPVRSVAFEHAQQIDLLFVDADGCLDAHLACVVERLSADCTLIFDDYLATTAPDKQDRVQRYVQAWLKRGAIRETAQIDGAWFGQVCDLAKLATREPYHDEGHAFVFYGVHGVIVTEDGEALGPGGTLHEEIRSLGRGRFDFHPAFDPFLRLQVPSVYFSSSDNSDPRTNGRRYEIR